MILFKRVGNSFRHIEDREWVLLFLETLGVLVGILLAFELQEWASQRSEAAKHRQLMERLFEESQTDVTVLRNFRAIQRGMAANERDFATSLSEGRCPAESTWSAVSTINMYPPITVPSGVYEELMGAGGLSSIEEPSVRAAIERFRGLLDFTARQSENFHAMNAAGGTALRIDDPRVTAKYDPSADEPEVITYDRTALCADRGFRNRMVDHVRDHGVIVSRQSDLTDSAIEMCARLGRLVGKNCIPPDAPLDATDQATAQKALRLTS